jgi:hypothetical protein
MPASRKKEERMWKLADELARSGEYENWLTIEWELRRRGYGRARQLLDNEQTRERFNQVCEQARKVTPAPTRAGGA